ncbi:mycofactocin biosynthesis peptidyl-dipeptidase MftE [Citricoccus sp. SGAir0253]|nr:mycofactocin biosynthesis peptidyl-dipeptidase MftE [Citricoccus sp. SGAir0253]
MASLRSPDAGGTRTLVVPLGSVEQHGPHLPLGTDGVIAEGVCRWLAGSRSADRDWVVGPLVPFGASGEHEDFPGTVSIGHQQLAGYLVELVRSASRWVPRVRFITGHGGNAPALGAACRLLASEGRDAAWTGVELPRADAHAGHTETSLMLHLAPRTVRMDLAQAGCTAPLERILPALVDGGVRAVSPSGVLGDPVGATAPEGARLFAQLCEAVADRLAAGRRDADGRLR